MCAHHCQGDGTHRTTLPWPLPHVAAAPPTHSAPKPHRGGGWRKGEREGGGRERKRRRMRGTSLLTFKGHSAKHMFLPSRAHTHTQDYPPTTSAYLSLLARILVQNTAFFSSFLAEMASQAQQMVHIWSSCDHWSCDCSCDHWSRDCSCNNC